MMTPNEALQLFMALKLHFSTISYDAIKYGYKLKNQIDYTKHKNKHLFEKLARHPDAKNLLIANLSFKPDMWVGNLFLHESEQRFRSRKNNQENLTYVFQETLDKIEKTDFKCHDGQHSGLLKKFMRNEISFDVMVILDRFSGFISTWDKDLAGDPIWEGFSFRLKKYKPFVSFDELKMKKILKQWLTLV